MMTNYNILLLPLIGLICACNGLQCFYGPSDTWLKQGIDTCEPGKTWCYNFTCENERGIASGRGCIEKPMTKQEFLKEFPSDKDECTVQSAPAKMNELLFCNTSLCNNAWSNKNSGPMGQMVVGVFLLLIALNLKKF